MQMVCAAEPHALARRNACTVNALYKQASCKTNFSELQIGSRRRLNGLGGVDLRRNAHSTSYMGTATGLHDRVHRTARHMPNTVRAHPQWTASTHCKIYPMEASELHCTQITSVFLKNIGNYSKQQQYWDGMHMVSCMASRLRTACRWWLGPRQNKRKGVGREVGEKSPSSSCCRGGRGRSPE